MFKKDYKRYVGGNWDWVQMFQLDYLHQKCKKFSNDKRFLDLGCGSLRLGSLLIPLLDDGKYIGLDYNQHFVELGIEKELSPEIVEEKKPQFIINDNFDLSEIDGKIDFVWVYQVFIHVNDDKVRTALKNIAGKLTQDGVSYATFTRHIAKNQPKSDYVYDHTQRTFYRSLDVIEQMYSDAGMSMVHVADTPKGGFIIKGELKNEERN